ELSLTSNGPGGIGGPSVTTSAAKISVNATSANANATVISTNPAGALIHNSSAGATLSISTAGPATISDLSGTTITVTSAAGVQEQGNIGTKLSNVTLTAGGTGSITRLRVVDKIVGASVTMNTSGGAIGGPTVVATIGVETSNLTVNTISVGTGGIFILNTSKDPLTVANATSNQGFSLYSYGPVTVNSITAGSDVNASTNSITVGARSGALIVNPASMLVATGGSVLLQNDDTKGGTINIGTGSTITGSSTVAGVGTVTINIGPTANKFVGTTPDNVTINNTAPGVTYFGKNGITALGPVNTINANKRDVIFDTDDKAANSITLGGGVIITADPPEGLADLPAPRTIAPAFTASAIALATQSVGAVQSSAVNSPFILPTIAPAQSFATVIAGLNGNMLDSLASSSGGLQAQARTLYGGIGAFAQPGNVQYGLINANVHTACDSAEASINSGSTLYTPDRDIVVKTTFGDVKIAAHSMALVMAFNHGIAVYDLDDTHHQSVVVEVGGRKIALAPGKHLLVTGNQYESFEEINPSAVIPYKGVTKTAINDSLAAFSADFHLPAAVYTIVPLRNMLASTDAGHKSRTSHLLKTAAIMLQLGNYASGYRTYTRPRLTAMR
ncbi:MAG: hypothetical protein JSS86_19205, partial [Cyanobacteria bacterium SZAS LIN-2]|nr:hypothetical protein [Cyanobacteria bacterium SZAS LIN-2]